MKRVLILVSASVLILTLLACEFAGINVDLGGGGDSSGGAKAAPVEAGVDSPGNNATLKMAPVDIAYHASSTDGISAVELSIDGAVVSSITTPASDQKVVAMKYTWNPMEAGSHTIRVRAQSSGGNWSDFYGVMVTVEGSQQTPAAEQPQQTQQQAPTDTPEPTATPKDVTIYDVKADKDIFYYGGGGCNREITITAKVTQPEKVYVMVLFIRFFDNEGGGTSSWDSGRAMSKKSDGSYSVTLFSEKIPNYNQFEFAAMNYQIKAQDKGGSIVAGTEVFKDVRLQICQ
jgi:hypothetical protein